jgi:hypothetical protein
MNRPIIGAYIFWQIQVLRDPLQDIGAQEHAPDIEELNEGELLVVGGGILEGDRENLRHKLLEDVDVVALHILENAVQNVHIGQTIASLILQ